jgi:hypothetical protein
MELEKGGGQYVDLNISVVTLTLGSWLSVKCARAHEAKSVFKCDTHFHKWGKVQGMKPNDSQVHSHFGNCICAGVINVQSLDWKGK